LEIPVDLKKRLRDMVRRAGLARLLGVGFAEPDSGARFSVGDFKKKKI
jgi:hypothetical protein